MMMMRSVLVLCLAVAAIEEVQAQSIPRVVSLAPSITEVLFEIGAGDRVAGVTSYCRYPSEAARRPKVGGYLTPSFEALAALAPDFVVVLPEHRDLERQLATLALPIVTVDHRTLDGIVESMNTLGARCGVSRTAEPAADALRHMLRRVRESGAGHPRPRVLLCFGRSAGLRRVYAAAAGSIHDDLLTSAGGANALASSAIPYPTLSAEGIMRLDPDFIIEFAPGRGDAHALRQEWLALDGLRAARSGRVHVLTQDFLSVPGPRFVRFVETLASILRGR